MGLDKYIPGSAQGVLANPLVIDITYAELVDKISLSALIPGQKYRITDYRTAYNMPNVTPAEKIVCTVEPLLVTANSVNTLSMYAYSEAYPQDEIYYDVANNQAKVAGCDMGYIYRRVDKLKNIDIGFDWRNVKFRRWQIDTMTEWDAGTTYAKRAVVKRVGKTELYISIINANLNNAVTDNIGWILLAPTIGLYMSPTPTNLVLGASDKLVNIPCTALYMDYYIFTTEATTNGVLSSMSSIYNIKIAQSTSNIIANANTIFIGTPNNFTVNTPDFYGNIFGAYSVNNIIDGQFTNNILWQGGYGTGFAHNTFSGSSDKCSYGSSFQYNTVNRNCVMAGTYFAGAFDNNQIRASIQNSFIPTTVQYNEINMLILESVFSSNMTHCIIDVSLVSMTIYRTNILANSNVKKFWFRTYDGTVRYYYYDDVTFIKQIIDPTTSVKTGVREYTALLSETGYSATSGALISGQTYYIASYVAGDDFANVGGTNVTGNTFVASGTTPTTWTNSSILVSVGISAPAVTLLTNGLSAAIVWTYSAVGTYIGTLTGAFTENKTVFSHPPLGNDKAVTLEWTSADVITLKTYDSGVLTDGLLVKFPLTIKVYP